MTPHRAPGRRTGLFGNTPRPLSGGAPVRRLLPCAVLLLGLAACGEAEPPSLAEARAVLDKGEAATAAIHLKNRLAFDERRGAAAPADTQRAEARFLLGRALLESGDATGADIELRRAQELGHPLAQVAAPLARAWTALRKPRQVTDTFASTTLDDAAATAELQTLVAGAYRMQGKLPEAEQATAAALAASPAHVPARLMQATLKAMRGQGDEAARITDDVLRSAPSNVQAHVLKGHLLAAAGQVPAAEAAFRAALRAQPDAVSAHAALVDLLLARNDQAAATAQWRVMNDALPRNPQTRLYEGRLALLAGDARKARELAEPLLRSHRDDVEVLKMAGAAELQLGATARAEAHLARASTLAPWALAPRLLLAQAYLQSGHYAKATELTTPVLALPAPPVEAVLLAAQTALLSGQPKQAQALYTRAAKMQPDDHDLAAQAALVRMRHDAGGDSLAELAALAERSRGVQPDLALLSTHLARKDWSAAGAAIDRIEGKQPGQPMAAELRGSLALQAGQVDDARRRYEEALQRDPLHYPALAGLAALDLGRGDVAAAKARVEAFLARDPQHLRALLALAELQARAPNGAADAGRTLARATAAHPEAQAAHLLLVGHHLRQRDFRAALSAAHAATAARPDDPELLERLARAQVAAGEPRQALRVYERLAVMLPGEPGPLLRKAEIHLAANEVHAAQQAVRRALDLDPGSLPALRAGVGLAMREKQPERALALARQAQQAQPKAAAGWLFEGEVQALRGEPAAAEKALRTALDKDGAGDAPQRLHQLLEATGRRPEAERFAAAWLQRQPADVGFVRHLGDTALSHRDWPQAERHYRTLVERRPRDAQALNNLAWLLLQQRKPGAVAFARRAVEAEPGNPAPMDTLAMSHLAEKNVDEAAKVQKAVLAIAPESQRFRLHMARIHLAAGDKPAARAQLTQVTRGNDSGPTQREARELLAQLD